MLDFSRYGPPVGVSNYEDQFRLRDSFRLSDTPFLDFKLEGLRNTLIGSRHAEDVLRAESLLNPGNDPYFFLRKK